MAKRKAVFMSCLLAIAFGITAILVAFAENKEESDGLLCVTSFYPVQLLAEAVSAGAEDVEVRNLTENHSGCIHDYTLTTQDMRLLSEAELFLINGGDMELFLERAAAEYEDLAIVDTSVGYDFLEGIGHNHDHEEETGSVEELHGHEEDEELCTDPTHHHEEETQDADAHAVHSHAVNAHIWMDIDGYLLQLSQVEEAFVKADPAQADLYRKNAKACRTELLVLQEEFENAEVKLSGRETVVFHEGFVYLLNMLGIESVHCLAMDSDTQIAAGEAAEIMEECKLHGINVLFAEADYAQTVADTFGKEISGTVVVLNPVTGMWSEDAVVDGVGNVADGTSAGLTGVFLYCEIMRKNLESIEQAYDVR